MSSIRISCLVLSLALGLAWGAPERACGTCSENALIQREMFEGVEHLTRGYAQTEWGVDLFAYPTSVCQGYLFTPDPTVLHTAATFFSDYAFHRITYTEVYTDWIRAYGSFGSGVGQFNSPSGIDCEMLDNYYLYVADTWNHRIVKLVYDYYTDQWTWLGTITGNGLVRPKDVDLNNGGDFFYQGNDAIWVINADRTIKKFDLNGNLLLTYDGDGEFGCSDLIGIACGRSHETTGPPYDRYANNNYIYVLQSGHIFQFLENPPRKYPICHGNPCSRHTSRLDELLHLSRC